MCQHERERPMNDTVVWKRIFVLKCSTCECTEGCKKTDEEKARKEAGGEGVSYMVDKMWGNGFVP